ncbi:unnamed protein product [Phytomonas sp. Hart1]|nr:unnamed protein product [Phytomonas sp. Hart1]|eukprot:CCW70472.1 unnamed protein product [Phytomonas sp. isolate Hart1]
MFTLSSSIRYNKNRCTDQHHSTNNIREDSSQIASLPSKGCTGLNRDTPSTLIESRSPCSSLQRTEITLDVNSDHLLPDHLNSVALCTNKPLEAFQRSEMDYDNSLQNSITHVLNSLVQKNIQRMGNSGSFQNTVVLPTAVSPSSDAYTAFERELLEEINRLRRDPASYAALVENEATLGYPFIYIDDEYYATDGAASKAHEYHPHSLLEAVARVTKITCPSGREDISLFLMPRNSPDPQANHQSNENIVAQSRNQKIRSSLLVQQGPPSVSGASCFGSEPLSVRSSSKGRGRSGRSSAMAQHRFNKSNTSTTNQGSHVNNAYSGAASSTGSPQQLGLQSTSEVTIIPSTLKKQGLTEMTLEQLGTHLRRHQLHRIALEKAAEDILIRWHLAQLTLLDITNVDDDRVNKKVGKGQHATSKEGMAACTPSLRTMALPQTGPYRKTHERTTNVEGAHQQRLEAAEKLRSIFAAHLRTILEKLCVENLICKRSMDGANLILECVQALRKVSPVQPLLPRRGLHLAARNVSLFHHAIGDCVSKAPTSSSPNMLLTSSSENLRNGREVQFLPFLSNLQDNSPIAIQEDGSANPIHILKEWVKSLKNQATNFFNANTHLFVHQLSIEAISKGINCIARMTHETCGKYGQVANQLRGVQLYGSGKPREVIIRAIMGVFIPQFVLHGNHFPETVKRNEMEAISRFLTDREILRLFKFSVFSSTFQQSEIDGGTALGTDPILDRTNGTTECTGIMLCGMYHPTTVGALVQRFLEQDSGSTSQGKRVVAATHRLGPLLWRDARVVGIGWQRACRPLTYDKSDKRSLNIGDLDEKDRTPNGNYVCTTIVLATEYEELELIAMNKHASLDEVNRIVQQCQEVKIVKPENIPLPILTGNSAPIEGFRAIKDSSQLIRSTTFAELPVMVDLHSNLGVQVVYPQCHPLVFEADFNTSRHSGVAVVVLRADRRSVNVRACLSTSSTFNSSSGLFSQLEMQASPEILVQRSVADRDVVLIMIDTMSVTSELLQAIQVPDSDSYTAVSPPQEDKVCFLRIFEKSIKVGDASHDKAKDAVMGYTCIGFIRLVFQTRATVLDCDKMMHSNKQKLLVSPDTRLQHTTCAEARGSAAQAAFGMRLTEVRTTGARKVSSPHSEQTLLGSKASVACGAFFLPQLYEVFLDHLDFSARASPLECSNDGLLTFSSCRDASQVAVAGTSGGWPDISAEFTDRGGCILSPLVSVLPFDSSNTPVRFAIYLPGDYQISGIASQQKEALLALLYSLEEIEAAEALKESTDIALMQEEAQNQGDTLCGSDAESKEKLANLSGEGSLRGEDNVHLTAGTENQVDEPVSTNACVNADGDGACAHSSSFATETAHQKEGLSRPKKIAGKSNVDESGSSPGGNKRSRKSKSPDKKLRGSQNLKGEQKLSKTHLGSNGNLSGLKQGSPRETISPSVTKFQDSSLSFFEDGNLDLIRLFDSPQFSLSSVCPKDKGVPLALSHDVLMSISIARLRNLVDEQIRLSSKRRELLIRVEYILCDELQRLEAEIPKRKGRDLIKLKRDEEDINNQLDQMREIVQKHEAEAQYSKEILTRRTRDRTLRRTRLRRVKGHLSSLFGLKYAVGDNPGGNPNSLRIADVGEPSSSISSPCDVVVWFVPKDSVPHVLQVASRASPVTMAPMEVPCARNPSIIQAPITSSPNNLVQLTPVALPGYPQSYRYEATVQVPRSLRGYAVLLVNGYECAYWKV